MRIITPKLVVEDSDAFKNDALERKSFGVSLLNLVNNSSDELVISLDGKWGEGKTTFIKMWQGLLLESNTPNIYIDAFANDYLDDPFISIASSITDFIDNNIDKDYSEQASDLRRKVVKVGGRLISWSTKVAVKAATLGAVKDCDIEELNDIKNDLAKSASELVCGVIEERLLSHSEDLELVKSFRKLLSEIPLKIRNNNNNPLVVIIDELDRCKPLFAVDLLERIKHLFSVENVVFVLVMHKNQLEQSVKCVYGENIDAHTYLQKFINIETALPKQRSEHRSNDLHSYSERLLQLHEIETWGDDRLILDCVKPLSVHFDLSLRQLEKVFTNLAIFYGSSGENQLRIVPFISLIAILKVVDQDLFYMLLGGKVGFGEFCKRIHLYEDDSNNRRVKWIISWFKYSLLTDDEFNKLEDNGEFGNFGNELWAFNIEREKLASIFAQKISMFEVQY